MSVIKPAIYLVKQNVTDPRKIFRKDFRLTAVHQGDFSLYFVKSKAYTPDWVDFLEEEFAVERSDFKNASSRAVIIGRIRDRLVAIPLGLGGHFLDLSKIDYNFGLRTALNCIPKSAIRQIDTTTPEANSQKTKKQTAVGTTPEQLGVNKQKDILRVVTGKLPSDHRLGKALEGKDSLRVLAGVENLEKLRVLCEQVLDFYQADTYKHDYGWIDNIAQVRDPAIITQLQSMLAKNLKNGRFEHMHFVPPVFFNRVFEHRGFAFLSGDGTRLSKKDTFEMPDMTDWKTAVGDARKELTAERLDHFKVALVGDDQRARDLWPLDKCLAWETDLAEGKYILSEGSWYAVDPDFFREVNRFYAGKVTDCPELPVPSGPGISEAAYNKEIADSDPDKHLFDLGHPDSRSKHIGADHNEVCDVYNSVRRVFYHVKMGKSSADISHLFRQGVFSGMVLKRDESVCKEFIRHLTGYGCPPACVPLPYNAGQYRIMFVLVLGKKQKRDIPFFSKVSFKDALENSLELVGYQCGLTFVGGR